MRLRSSVPASVARAFPTAALLLLTAGGAFGRPRPMAGTTSVTRGDGPDVLAGAIDIHTHPDPDSRERSINAIDFARLARQSGMRGFVIKQHEDQTAGQAFLVRQVVPDVEVFGAIVLNKAMGGVNVAAVERFARVAGGWGRLVFMPTVDAPEVPVSRNGELLPEVKAVLNTMANIRTRDSHGRLALATGHVTPEESLLLVREAQRLHLVGVVVTHPLGTMSLEQMREAAARGAFIEFVAARALAGADAEGWLRRSAAAIRAVGPESAILSSDLGRPDLPRLEPRGLATVAEGLRRYGITDEELTVMMKTNPARLLGLPEPTLP